MWHELIQLLLSSVVPEHVDATAIGGDELHIALCCGLAPISVKVESLPRLRHLSNQSEVVTHPGADIGISALDVPVIGSRNRTASHEDSGHRLFFQTKRRAALGGPRSRHLR